MFATFHLAGYLFPQMTAPIAARFTTACLLALAGAMPLAAASYELLPSQDARILGLPGYENANFTADILSLYTQGQNIQRTLMQFDLSGVVLEPGERLASATLTLSAFLGFGGSNGRPMEIYAVTRPWTEDGLTWNRATAATPWSVPGGDFAGQGWATNGPPFAVSTAIPARDGELVTRDIRALVDQWLEGLGPNHGLLLKSYEGNGLIFTQRESSSAELRPVLRLVTESGPPRRGSAVTRLADLDAGLHRANAPFPPEWRGRECRGIRARRRACRAG